jgi:hypothetical protein
LIWFAGVAAIMIALVGAVTLTAEATPTPSPTLFPTFTHTPAPRTGTPARPTRTHTPRPRGTLTSSPTFTATPSPAYLQCAWQWARQPVPEITQQAQDFFIKAEFSVGIWVETYGENCIDYRAGTPTVAYFAAMTTDFYLNIYSTNLSDARSLAESYVKAYQLLVEFSAEADLPARPGYLTMTFNAPGYFTTVRAMFSDIQALLDDALTGQALLEALGGWPVTPIPQPT